MERRKPNDRRRWSRRGLLLALALAGLLTIDCSIRSEPRNLVIVSLDTVRRDHVGAYGYRRDTTPSIDDLASRSLVFDGAIAQDTNTNPSHASMFTGVYPHIHGSLKNAWVLAPDQVTLAQILQRSGFRTGGFVSAHTMHRKATGLERGFEVYGDRLGRSARRDGTLTARRALEWLASLNPDDRFFLFVHLYDAHGPYDPPESLDDLFESNRPGPTVPRIPGYQAVVGEDGRPERRANEYVDRYDRSIRHVDAIVAYLLEQIDLDDTIVLIVADHGETLAERYHPFDHGGQLFDEQVRIPLILSAPGVGPGRTDATVESVDLLPSLLELLDVTLPDDRPVQGRSFAALLRGEPWTGREYAFSSAHAVGGRHGDRYPGLDSRRRIHSVRTDGWKLIRYPGLDTDYLELYELDEDPKEKRNVAAEVPDVRQVLVEQLRAWGGDTRLPAERQQPDEETLEKLKSLGYVGS